MMLHLGRYAVRHTGICNGITDSKSQRADERVSRGFDRELLSRLTGLSDTILVKFHGSVSVDVTNDWPQQACR
jgi:hypothetical protein